jgi:alkylglycerol monooxygenase
LFGTFQEERKDVPPVYGITRPVQTWNPIKINFMHLWLLIKDAWRAKRFWDKLRIWFMPLGWRPTDVAERFPIYKIQDVYGYKKYNPNNSASLMAWVWFQLIMLLLLVSYLFGNIAKIGSPGIFIYGGFIFLMVYAFTDLMDRNFYSIFWETIKNGLGIYLIIQQGDWFGVSSVSPIISKVLIAYFIFSTTITVWLSFQQRKEEKQMAHPV